MNLTFDVSAQRILYQFCAAAFIIATHGWFLALAARLLGDRGPQYDGRLTLNPFAHAEPLGALMLILTQFGWVRPITLDPRSLIGGRLGPLLVSLAALVATLTVAWLLWHARPFVFRVLTANSLGITVIGLIETTARMSVHFAVLNIVPILPLSLGHALIGLLPNVARRLERYRFPIALALALVTFIWLSVVLRGPSQTIARALFGQ